MWARVLLLLLLVLLADTAGAFKRDGGIIVRKCCREYEMLSANGESCVDAPWPRNVSFQRESGGRIVPPLDIEWLRRWIPPGLPMQEISQVISRYILSTALVISVNASSLEDPDFLQLKDLSSNTVHFVKNYLIARPKPGGGVRWADCCVDAALSPLGPFAMRCKTMCSEDECAYKCCRGGQMMVRSKGYWTCKEDAESFWSPSKSSFKEDFDAEFPFGIIKHWKHGHLLPYADRKGLWARNGASVHHSLFNTYETCADFYRSSNGSLIEGLFICDFPRFSKGLYRMLRPLCVLSGLLLLASLVAIACDKSMRRKTHGWCLACHTACLLAFNIGQIVYYVAISDQLDDFRILIPNDLQTVCKYFGLWMYFLLIAAWCWLTALCINMEKGFNFQVIRSKKGSSKRFFALSIFAWGLPVLMTITCSFLIAHEIENWKDAQWYNPSLAESRVCFDEFIAVGRSSTSLLTFLKSGTALFYFGPLSCLLMCNMFCLVLSLKKVQYLKQGNSVLRRQEDQIPLGHRQPQRKNTAMVYSSMSHRNGNGLPVDAKTIKLYIKMILMTGGMEFLLELIVWSTTVFDKYDTYGIKDSGMAYRAAGYVTDFFRAAVVTWLAAPEGGYLGLVRRQRRGKGEKKKNVA